MSSRDDRKGPEVEVMPPARQEARDPILDLLDSSRVSARPKLGILTFWQYRSEHRALAAARLKYERVEQLLEQYRSARQAELRLRGTFDDIANIDTLLEIQQTDRVARLLRARRVKVTEERLLQQEQDRLERDRRRNESEAIEQKKERKTKEQRTRELLGELKRTRHAREALIRETLKGRELAELSEDELAEIDDIKMMFEHLEGEVRARMTEL